MKARKRKWTRYQLEEAVKISRSIRQVLGILGLVEAGGNYASIKKFLKLYKINTSHFTGPGWRRGSKIPMTPPKPLEEVLIKNCNYQSYRLKLRLFAAQLKPRYCEECGWAEVTKDGRLPLELDHINGDRYDNRLDNLRILCPNCHSLKPTHRGLNRKK